MDGDEPPSVDEPSALGAATKEVKVVGRPPASVVVLRTSCDILPPPGLRKKLAEETKGTKLSVYNLRECRDEYVTLCIGGTNDLP